MATLTKPSKQEMTKKMVERRFQPEVDHLLQEFKTLADDIWRNRVGRYRKHIDALPNKWFVETSQIKVECGAQRPSWQSRGLTHFERSSKWSLEMSESRKMPLHVQFEFTSGDFYERYHKLWREEKALFEIILEIEDKIMTQLNSLRTTKRIEEHWPEASEFLPSPPNRWLPAIPIDTLNAELGLGDTPPVHPS